MFSIQTNRLIIRDWQIDDVSDANEYASDPDVCKFMDWGPNSKRETENFIDVAHKSSLEMPRRGFELAIQYKDNEKVIGGVGLAVKDQIFATAMLGYALNREYWGRGIASEASLAMLKFGFLELELHRIFATCDTRNTASEKVLQKCGMRREAHFLEDAYVKGAWRDSYLYAILKKEWKNLKGSETS